MALIHNHIAPPLSALDLEFARHVPPGGNWKNIPDSVPSKRLDNIRASYSRGEGSRSTYYGRLRAEAPAYTISTYFTRPGNGCHFHYEQERTLSYREAARLQSFPDSFVFSGSNAAVAKQIGNAVPPLMSYAIAAGFNLERGYVIDLFCGAGGLSLGFHWAGWEGVAANDSDVSALETFQANVHTKAVAGSIRDQDVREALRVMYLARPDKSLPVIVLGGPPCQGFSTAGNRRTRQDERNSLFQDYCELVDMIDPAAFVFENVTGITNMEGGAVYREVTNALEKCCDRLITLRVAAEQYGVPQRRRRILIVGLRGKSQFCLPAGPLGAELFGGSEIGVFDALSDLPPLKPGEDGTQLEYLSPPVTDYQRLMRGKLSPARFAKRLTSKAVSASYSSSASART